MKVIKKLLSIFLIVVMCLTSAPLQGFLGLEWLRFSRWFSGKASARYTYVEGYYEYTVSTSSNVSTANIKDVNQSIEGDIIIPSTLGGYSVRVIGYRAFSFCSELVSVTMSESVTDIGAGAFEYCEQLENVIISNNVTSIRYETFFYCDSLKSITIPYSVNSVDSSAFFGCRSLTDVYYNGTIDQWKRISIYNNNEYLEYATIHCSDGIYCKENDDSNDSDGNLSDNTGDNNPTEPDKPNNPDSPTDPENPNEDV